MQSTDFKPSAELKALCDAVEAMAREHTKIDFERAVISGALMMLTMGTLRLPDEDRSALQVTPMSDAWVCAAAALPYAAPGNLSRLLKRLEAEGFVSIAAADRFCMVELDREREAARRRHIEAQLELARHSPGYHALAHRLADAAYAPDTSHVWENWHYRSHATMSEASRGILSAMATTSSLAGSMLDRACAIGQSVGESTKALMRGKA